MATISRENFVFPSLISIAFTSFSINIDVSISLSQWRFLFSNANCLTDYAINIEGSSFFFSFCVIPLVAPK